MTERSDSLDTARFIAQLDRCFGKNDMRAARACIDFWEAEARRLGDDGGLLTVLSEAVGFYRRSQKKGRAIRAMEECLSLVERLGLENSLTGATVFINAATTVSFFGREEEGLRLYDRAADCYIANRRTASYEYAALLNNKAGTYYTLGRLDEAEAAWREAIAILKSCGGHDGEVAISLVMLAHAAFDRGDGEHSKIEALLDEAWEYINAEGQPRDGNYAYVLRKCAPSYDFFQRHEEAQALRDVAREIQTLFSQE